MLSIQRMTKGGQLFPESVCIRGFTAAAGHTAAIELQHNHPLTPYPARDVQNNDYCLVQQISVTAYSEFVCETGAPVLLSLNDWLQQSHQRSTCAM